MTVSVKCVLKSTSDYCPPLYTIEAYYPLAIHAEVMTHRIFSRNSASNRAIKTDRLISAVVSDPFIPHYFGSEQRGMQAGEELDELRIEHIKNIWHEALSDAVYHATKLKEIGLHKQHVNRILMPFQHIRVLITATDWDNFFALRDHPDAQPEIIELARSVKSAMDDAPENHLKRAEWHLPYATEEDKDKYTVAELKRITSARCAKREL